MKKRSQTLPFGAFLLVFLLIFLTNLGLFGQKARITAEVNPPAPTRVTDLQTGLRVTVENLTASPLSLRYLIDLRGTSGFAEGIRIETRQAAWADLPTFDLAGGAAREYAYASIQNQANPFDRDQFDIEVSAEQEAFLETTFLPPGGYRLCVSAIDETDQVVSVGGGANCLVFSVDQFSSPQLVEPEDQSAVTASPSGAVRFKWTHDVGSGLPPGLEYDLEIYRLLDGTQMQQLTSAQIDNRAGVDELAVLTVAAYPDFRFVGGPDDVVFVEGEAYAARLRAKDPALFTDGRGTSNVAVFAYGQNAEMDCAALQPENVEAELVFPSSSAGQIDTLPFTSLPVIAAFLPECEQYRRLETELRIRKMPDGPTVEVERALNWPHGPKHFLENFLEQNGLPVEWVDAEGGDYSFAYGFNLDNVTAGTNQCHAFERGKKYRLAADFRMTVSGRGEGPKKDIAAAEFVAGMPEPRLLFPRNEQVFEQNCPINLQIQTGHPPMRPLPPLQILNIDGQQLTNCNWLAAREKMVLQVARDAAFEDIVFRRFKKIQANAWDTSADFDENAFQFEPSMTNWVAERTYDEAAFLAKVYREFEFPFDAAQATGGAAATGVFFWRVGWAKEGTEFSASERINSESDLANLTDADFYRFSSVQRFEIRAAPCTEAPPTDPDAVGACIAVCEAEEVPPSERDYLTTLAADGLVTVGKFQMRVKNILHRTAGAEGEGEIQVPFLNNARIAVEFEGLKSNASGRVWAGTVKAKTDLPGLIPGGLVGRGAAFAGIGENEARALDEAVNQTARTVSGLLNAEAIGMPLGFDAVVDSAADQRVTIAVVAMHFSPVSATLNAVFSLDFPELNGWLSLGATDVCFYPSGLDLNRATLFSPTEKRIPFGDRAELVFPAANFAARDTGTYVSWDCRGFRKAVIAGHVEFSREVLVPDTPEGQPAPTGTVKARFKFTAKKGDQYMGRVAFDNFQMRGLEGWGFTVADAWLDFSDSENPRGLRFPRGYAGDQNLNWKGFFLGRAAVRLPQEFRTSSESTDRLTVALDSMLIDRTGLSVSVTAENIVNSGRIDGWQFSLDRFFLQIVSNSVAQGGLRGRVFLPIDDDTPLDYSAILQQTGSDRYGFQFLIRPAERIDAELWEARLSVAATSVIGINLGHWPANADRNGDGRTDEFDHREGIYAVLNGALSIESSTGMNLNFGGMTVEGLTVNSWGPRFFDCRDISFASPEKQMQGFPIGLSDFEFVNVSRNALIEVEQPPKPGQRVGFSFNLRAEIMEGNDAFEATANLGILGRVDVDLASKRFDVGFAGFDFNELAVSGSVGAVAVRGGLKLYRSDATYGDGFKGWLDATFKPTIRLRAVAQFGHVQDFDYWMVDASAEFTPGITLFAGVVLNGFCGGVWGNMAQQAANLHQNIRREGQNAPSANALSEPGTTGSGLVYRPERGALGFRAGLIFGPQAGDAYRATVVFSAQFSPAGSLQMMRLDGDVVVLPQENSNDAPPIRGTLAAFYDFEHSIFQCNVEVFANVAGVLRGAGAGDRAGHIQMYASPQDWWLYVNRPADRGGLRVGIAGVAEVGFDFYMQIGSRTDPMPPVPEAIARHFSAGLQQIDPRLTAGGGFMFGASLGVDIRPVFACFYAEFGLLVGFDMALKDVRGANCAGMEGQTIGVNGWYATGQMYARVVGAVGIEVDVFFCQRCRVEAFRVEAGAILQAGLPNPVWMRGGVYGAYSVLGGAVSGSVTFEFSVGNECRPPVDPFGGLPIIADVKPENGSTGVDCGTVPAATFNLRYDAPFSVTEPISAAQSRVRTFRILYRPPVLTDRSNGATVAGRVVRSNENRAISFVPNDFLKARTRYRFAVTAYAEELLDGAWQLLLQNGRPAEQTSQTEFETGTLPETIRPQDAAYSWPLHNHQHFLQESNGRVGFLRLNRAVDHVFSQPAPTGSRWEYYATIQTHFSQEPPRESPLVRDGLCLRFNVPPLGNGQLFSVKLMKRLRSAPVVGSNGTFPIEAQSLVIDVSTNQQSTTAGAQVNVQTSEIEQTAILVNSEKILYEWYFFKDATLNGPAQKFAQVAVAEGPPASASPAWALRGRLNVPPTDPRELYGFHYEWPLGTVQRVAPMLSLTSAWDNDWQRLASSLVFDLSRQLWNRGLRVHRPFQDFAGQNFPFEEKSLACLTPAQNGIFIDDFSAVYVTSERGHFRNRLNAAPNLIAQVAQQAPELFWRVGETMFDPPVMRMPNGAYRYHFHYQPPPSGEVGFKLLGAQFLGPGQLRAPVAPPVVASIQMHFSAPVQIFFPPVGWALTNFTFTP